MISINLNQEFDALVKATLAEKQLISNDKSNNNDKENNQPKMTDKSAKNPNFFQSNKPSTKRTIENIPLHASNREIFSQIFHMLE